MEIGSQRSMGVWHLGAKSLCTHLSMVLVASTSIVRRRRRWRVTMLQDHAYWSVEWECLVDRADRFRRVKASVDGPMDPEGISREFDRDMDMRGEQWEDCRWLGGET